MTTPDLAPPEEGITVGGPDSGPPLPHWTDPPTGEIPRVLRDTEAEESDDDLSAWEALGAKGLRWRDGAADWGDVDEMRALGGDEARWGRWTRPGRITLICTPSTTTSIDSRRGVRGPPGVRSRSGTRGGA